MLLAKSGGVLGVLNDMGRGQMFAPGGDVGGVGEVDAFEDVVDERAEVAGVDFGCGDRGRTSGGAGGWLACRLKCAGE